MKRTKVDTSTEQKIVTAMVVSKDFLSQAVNTIDASLFQAKHLQQVAKWSLSYFNKYRESPKENIESLYHAWVRRGKASEEMVDAVHDVLEYLSTQYEESPTLNIPYLLDTTADYFNLRRIEALKDELEYALAEGDRNAASTKIAEFSTVSAAINLGVDPLNDDLAWDSAFGESQQPLFAWKNKAADTFFGPALCRDGLIGVLAPEKRGKTWWCVEFAMRAVSQRRRVALFEVGDMSQSQIMRRLGVRLSRRPMFKRYLGRIDVPKGIERNDEDISIRKVAMEFDKIASAESSKRAVQKFLRSSGIKQDDPHFMVSVHPNSSVNVRDLTTVLEQWEAQKGFIPDVIIIDYPDILAPEPGTSGMTTRDQINTTWKALRRMSQERHCLVIAPTQADAASYSVETLDASNFSEDKRKLAHVTGMLGLNQTRDEKARGIMRLNWIALREADFQTDLCLHVACCFQIGKAFCCATL